MLIFIMQSKHSLQQNKINGISLDKNCNTKVSYENQTF